MTGKERIEAVFEGRTPDRTPTWEQGFASRPASEILGRPAKTGGGRFRFEMACAAWRGADDLAEYQRQAWADSAALAEALDWDVASVPWGFAAKPARWIDACTFAMGDEKPGGVWSVHRFDPATDTFQELDHSLRDADIGAFERYVANAEAWARDRPASRETHAVPPGFLEMIPASRAVAAGTGLAVPYRPVRWLEVLAERPDLIERWLDLQVERARVVLLAAARQGCRYINGGGDFCYNGGPMYAPRIFRDLMLPRLREIVRVCDEHGLWYVWRTDGWTWPVAEDLFRTSGVHGYGEIDAQAGMDLAELRQAFPDLVLVGGIDCGRLLQNGTPQEIAEAARRAVRDAGPRHILSSSNVIHSEIPAENYLAMWRVAVGETSPPPPLLKERGEDLVVPPSL